MKAYQICINCGHAIETKIFHEHFPQCFKVYYYAQYDGQQEHNWIIRKVDIEKDWK